MRTSITVFVGIVLLTASFGFAEQQTDKILKQISGTWEVDDGVNQGRELSDEELEGVTVKVTKHMIYTYDRDNKELYKARYKIDATKNPIAIDMTSEMKGVPPSQALGILKLDDDDEWVLCYALPGAPRPTQFKSASNSKVMLFELERDDD